MEREEIINKFWEIGAKYIDLTKENDAIPQYYGEIALCYTERHILLMIGDHPDITVSEIASIIHKTPSICSQVVRKFVNLGWVEQKRNEKNRRIYNLQLTEEGIQAYEVYASYRAEEKRKIIHSIRDFSVEELETYVKVQMAMNEAGTQINAYYTKK